MKRCPYCGKEYPDDTMSCLIDGELLFNSTPQLAVSKGSAIEGKLNKDEPYLTFPDYKWTAMDAWKCAGMITLLEIIFALSFRFPEFHNWRLRGFGYFSTSIFSYTLSLLTAAYFGRTETLATFWKGFGLDRKPSNYLWLGVILALAIRCLGQFIRSQGWSSGVPSSDFYGFKHTFGSERYFFLLPALILAPLFEESIYRGFLFKAFRGSYLLSASIALIVAWTANTHWSSYSHSWIAALDLSALTVVQCYLREKSDSIWDCIACHFAFNASSLLFVKTPLW